MFDEEVGGSIGKGDLERPRSAFVFTLANLWNWEVGENECLVMAIDVDTSLGEDARPI